MFKKIKSNIHNDVSCIASECEQTQKTVSDNISEILKLVESINKDLKSGKKNKDQANYSHEIINENQIKAS